MSDISNRIDKLLYDRKLRRVDLVRAIGISESTIRSWQKSSPSAEAAVKVSQFFNVSIEWLITGQDNSDNQKKDTNFSADELELITIFRALCTRDKDFLLLNARTLISRAASEQPEAIEGAVNG